MDEPEPDTAQEFLWDRLSWLKVKLVQGSTKGWWSIALIIDGEYSDKEMAEGVAEMFREDLRAIKDIPQSGWRDWDKR